MDKQLKDAIYIGLELILTATVLGLVAASLFFGNSLFNHKQNERISKYILETEADLYKYTRDNYISESDIIDIMLTYSKVYEFAVVDSSGAYIINTNIDDSFKDIKNWSLDNLNSKLEGKETTSFYLYRIYTTDGFSLQGLVFSQSNLNSDLELKDKIKKELGFKDSIYK